MRDELRVHGRTQVADFTAAWGALEVFIVSIIAAVLQISQFARYVIGAALPGNENAGGADGSNEARAPYTHQHPCPVRPPRVAQTTTDAFGFSHTHAQGEIFDVQTELNEGTWVLLAASFMLVTTNSYISSLSRRAIKDREGDVLNMKVRYASSSFS